MRVSLNIIINMIMIMINMINMIRGVELFRAIFLTYGLPEKVTSDNGPPFQSHNHETAEYLKVKDIIHY